MIWKSAFLSLLFFPVLVAAQTAELLSKAKKEGEVILYTTMTVRDFEFLNRAAKEEYPFLNIRHVYLASGRQVTRVMHEYRAGRVQTDVLGNNLEPLLYFKSQGVTAPYRSAEAKNLLPDAADPEGYWSGITTDLLLTGFNPRMISRAAVPKNYDDYLKPQYKGQIRCRSIAAILMR
jgi:ABC-type Fe3+ transport system substrate-binding protein